MNKKMLNLGLTVLLMSVSAAQAVFFQSVIDPADYSNNPTFTSQFWSLSANSTDSFTMGKKSFKIDSDSFTNHFGTPTATFDVQAYNRPSGWFQEHNSAKGVIYGEFVDLAIDIPNQGNQNDVKHLAISVHYLGTYLDEQTTINAGDGYSSEFNLSVTQPDYSPIPVPRAYSWKTVTEYWTITPQPASETINMHFMGTGADIDSILVTTVCLPEPATMTILGLPSLLFLINRKK